MWRNIINCSVKGYIAEEVFPVPIVPVIKKFWYNPFSEIIIFFSELISFPINKFIFLLFFKINLFDLIFLGEFFEFVKLLEKYSNLFIKIYMKIKLTKMYRKIKLILKKFQSNGFFWQMSKEFKVAEIIISEDL